MSTIAFVPVRAGSRGIPGKNIREFCGKPLAYWCLQALQEAARIDRVVVSTDGDEIERVVTGFGFDKVEVFRRGPETATDTASTESAMLEYLRAAELAPTDLFVLVQATSPFTSEDDFDRAIDDLRESGADSLLSCVRTTSFFWDESGRPLNYDPANRPRRQDFDGYLMENGAFYVNRVENVLRDENRLSGRIRMFVMPEYTGVEIDEDTDWIIAEALHRHHRQGR